MNKAVSDYMREMQARCAKSRWSGLTAAEKSAAMKALRAKGKRKPKRVARRSQASSSATLLESVAKRLERRARDMHKARAFNDEERTQRRCMVVIYMEISNMLRAECAMNGMSPFAGAPTPRNS